MRISIIMPSYNRSFTVPTALNSIISQTYKEWELLVIDDGSIDNTQEVVQKYVEKDCRIKYFKIQHKGSPYAWNFGIARANNDFIFFIGDDCKLHKNCLENLIKTADKPSKKNFGAIAPRLLYVKNLNLIKKEEEAFKGKVYAYIDLISGDVVGSFNAYAEKTLEVQIVHGYSLTRKKVLEEVGGFDQKTYKGNFYREETDLWLRIRRRGYKLYYEPKAKIYCQKSLTKGGQWSNVGGNPLTYEYYVLHNQNQFLKKFYGKRRFFMLPAFLVRRLYVGLLQLHAYAKPN
jgi:glycosyltransferase involved in cell wall biosynthesis